MKNFFREAQDENGVKYLTLKLSERPVVTKPSKNILKRWNLSNGMLYFFYSAVGRTDPPTGDEVLEPFYYQKRIDFIRKACLPPGGADDGSNDAAGSGGPRPAGLTASSAHRYPSGQRKRRRVDNLLEVALPPTELQLPAAREDAASLFDYLRTCFPNVDEGAVSVAVDSGVWTLVSEDRAASAQPPAARPRLHYSSEEPPRVSWQPALEKVEEWSFENGAMQVFVRACKLNWAKVQGIWTAWNDDLGNNSLDWLDLWRGQPVNENPFQDHDVDNDHDDLPELKPEPTHLLAGSRPDEDLFKVEVELSRSAEDDCLPFVDECGAAGGWDAEAVDDQEMLMSSWSFDSPLVHFALEQYEAPALGGGLGLGGDMALEEGLSCDGGLFQTFGPSFSEAA